MTEVAVAVLGANFGTHHAVAAVAQLTDVGWLDGFGETGPAGPGLVFVGRGEQRLARNDIDIDTGLLIVQKLARAGTLGAVFLRDAVLLARQAGNGRIGLAVFVHE